MVVGSMFKWNNSSSVRGGRSLSSSFSTTASFSCWVIILLVAFAAALVGVMVVDKLRERRIFNLVMKHKDRQISSLRLFLQREKGYNKEMKKNQEEMRSKAYALRSQKMELDRRVLEMQSTIHSLKDEHKVLESTMEEKQKEIKILRGITTVSEKDDENNPDSKLTTGFGSRDSKLGIGKKGVPKSLVSSTEIRDGKSGFLGDADDLEKTDEAKRDANSKIKTDETTNVVEQKLSRVDSKDMTTSKLLQADRFPRTHQDTREMVHSGSRERIWEMSDANSTEDMVNGNGQLEKRGESKYGEENSVGGMIKLKLTERSDSEAGSKESGNHGLLSRSNPEKENSETIKEKNIIEKIKVGNSTEIEELESREKNAEWEPKSEKERMPSKRFYDQKMSRKKSIDVPSGNGTNRTEDATDKTATDVQQEKRSSQRMEGALKQKATEDTKIEDEEEPEEESALKELESNSEEDDKEEYKEETDESEF